MALTTGGSGRTTLSEINVTPLVDVMLVLLIVFMVTAPLIQQGVEVALPEARAQAVKAEEQKLVLSIKADRSLWLGGGDDDEDVGQFMSAEYDFIGFDEATQFTPYQMLMISGRLRTSRKMANLGVRTHVTFATNPGDKGHTFLYKMLVQPTANGRYAVVYDVREGFENPDIVHRIELPDDNAELAKIDIPHDPNDHLVVAFVPSTADDNPHIDPTYRKHLSMLPETERKQKLLGDWDTFTGQYFTEFRHRLDHRPLLHCLRSAGALRIQRYFRGRADPSGSGQTVANRPGA